MPLVRLIKNKSGAEGFVVGITPKDLFMLRHHGMCQIDVRTFATGAASIVLVLGDTDEQILDIIDPNRGQIVVAADKPISAAPAGAAPLRQALNGSTANIPLTPLKDVKDAPDNG